MVLKRYKGLAIVGGLLVLVALISALEFGYRLPRSPYGAEILDSRPAGYWDLGEFNGPEVHDVARAVGPAGEFRGSIGFGTRGAVASASDTAVQFDGSGGAVILRPAASGQPSSLAFWLRPDSGAALGALTSAWRPAPEGSSALLPWLVASQTTGTAAWTIAFEVPDRLSVDYRRRSESHALRTTARIESGRFSFIVLTLGRDGPRLWIDGRRAAGRPRRIAAFPLGPRSPLTFGGQPGVGLKAFAGTLDDVAAFRRRLRGDEIRRLWRLGRSGSPG